MKDRFINSTLQKYFSNFPVLLFNFVQLLHKCFSKLILQTLFLGQTDSLVSCVEDPDLSSDFGFDEIRIV